MTNTEPREPITQKNKLTSPSKHKRRLQQPKRNLRNVRSWFIKRPIPTRKKVPSTYFIIKKTLRMLRELWPQMVGSTTLLALFTLLFVSSSTASFNFQQLHDTVNQFGLTTSEASSVVLAQLTTIANITPAANTAASVYQMIIFVLFSLAFIWAFRSHQAGEKTFTTKDMFYSSTSSLTQFVLVLAALTIAVIPMILGLFLFDTLIAGLIAVSGLQRTVVYAICGLLIYVSIRFLTGWTFGLYISGLPSMTPVPALKYGTKLVFGRRLVVLRKTLVMTLVLLVVLSLLLLPCIVWVPLLAPWLFFAFSVLLIPFSHAFAYTLYKELLG
jgi:hypothetical protein